MHHRFCAFFTILSKYKRTGGLYVIYFLEDDDSIRKLVIYGLESQGFEAEGFSLPSKFCG